MRLTLCACLLLLTSPLRASLVLFVPATDGFVLCGDKRITAPRDGREFDIETKVHSVNGALAWSATGNTAFYRSSDGSRAWDAFALGSSLAVTRQDWTPESFTAALENRLTEAFRATFENQRMGLAVDPSLLQTFVFAPDPNGLRLLTTTYLFEAPNTLRPQRSTQLLEHTTAWGSGRAFLAELGQGSNPAFDALRANSRIMDFLHARPLLPLAQATPLAQEVIALASAHAHLFPNMHISPTSDCLSLPRP